MVYRTNDDSSHKSFYKLFVTDLRKCLHECCLVLLITSLFSVCTIFLLRIASGFIVWTILLGSFTVSFVLACYFAIKCANNRDDASGVYCFAMVVMILLSIVLFSIVFAVRKKISLVIALFKECGKIVADIPSILLQPFVVNRVVLL